MGTVWPHELCQHLLLLVMLGSVTLPVDGPAQSSGTLLDEAQE